MRTLSKKQAKAKIEALARQFSEELPQLKSGKQVKEAHVEEKYIKPFFRALNWNTDNEGLPLRQEEFVVQATQVVQGSVKAPDYLLRLPDPRRPHVMRRHLFIEAKHPKYSLRTDVRWIRQTYLYAHSTFSETDKPENRVRLAVLTDFEELRLFDCIDPGPLLANDADLYNKQIVPGFDLSHAMYIDEFEKVWDAFERNNVSSGSLDQLVVTADDKARNRSAPDTRFLQDLEEFRLLIAQGITTYNPRLSDDDVTASAQLILDRIVFVKMLFDRGLEPDYLSAIFKALEHHSEAGVALYDACSNIFEDKLDKLYNGSLFKRRDELDDVKVDNGTIRTIIARLHPSQATYTLAAMPVEIVGYAYERFLGHVLERKGSKVEAVPKPEVRRAGGVYYTPRHIVEHIVEKTVGAALSACESPEDAAKLRVLDPACGSGSFLIVAYERILAWHRDWFITQIPNWLDAQGRVRVPREYQNHVRVAGKAESGRAVRLTLKLRRDILTNNIFGVDIDAQAVEVTRFSLSMKELEDVTRQEIEDERTLFKQRILPDLTGNIRCGNSLIGDDLQPGVSIDDRRAVRPFNWKREFRHIAPAGFDVVLGNPPYDVLEKDRGKASWPHSVLQMYVKEVAADLRPAMGGKLNLFRFFIIRGVELTREGGRFGMIVPMSLLADISTSSTREYLLTHTEDLELECFPQKDNAARRVFADAKLSTVIAIASKVVEGPRPEHDAVRVSTYPWNTFDDDPLRRCTVRVSDLRTLDPDKVPIPLVDDEIFRLCLSVHRHPRVTHLGDVTKFKIRRGEVNQTTYKRFITSDASKARMLKGSEVAPFRTQAPSQGEREWLDERACLASLKQEKTRTEWATLFRLPRIATQRITGVDDSRRLIALVTTEGAYFADSTNSISGQPEDLEYLAALLNSALWQWRFRLTSTNNNVQTNDLASLPYRSIDQRDERDRQLGRNIVQAATTLRRLYTEHETLRGAARVANKRELERLEAQLNADVYRLYDLSDADIELVARTTRVSGGGEDADDENDSEVS